MGSPPSSAVHNADAAWSAMSLRLAREIDTSDPSELGAIIVEAVGRYRDARIEAFVPILVERFTRREAQRRGLARRPNSER